MKDYYKKEGEFIKRVEKDAISFKPFGEKIHTYKRKSALGKGKGKAIVSSDDVQEDDNVILYEVYHVRKFICQKCLPLLSQHDWIGDMGDTWLPRIPSKDADIHPFVY